MNTQSVNRITTRPFLKAAAAVGLLLIVCTIQNFGQKEVLEARRATSRDGLMDTGYLTKGDMSDDLDGTDDEFFYKFAASSGKLTVTVEVTANETNAGAMLDLFGANSKAILSDMLAQAANGGSERVSKSVNIFKKQDIIIRIKGLRYGSSAGYPGTYKIVLEGPAASFKDVASSGGTGEAKQPDEPLSQPIVIHPSVPFAPVYLGWDGGPDHPNVEVWLSMDNGVEIPAFSMNQGQQSPVWKLPKVAAAELQLQRRHYYKFILKAAGKTLSTAAFVVP